ncbi:NAD-dependent epimerase/dehydratase family protein [Owenweeksia hongkongensis]|uniref:NAD-dependent epimerase/dehydratase family protein n=1 Tax=Owenweeksia hongkongensis TaxID=253245 RepID=UPI003A8F56D2
MKVIVTGASGMVGKGVLLECLDHHKVMEVLSIGRRTLDLTHPKLKQIEHKDFSEFESIADQLMGYDACYACMGVSSAGMKEEQYRTMTYDYTMALANVLYGLNAKMTFIYVSGQGTDSSEKGRIMWARVKGKTENDVFKLGFNQAYAFRPGAIIPMRGVESSSKLYNFLIKNLGWLIKLMKKISPNSIVNTRQIGVAMINASIAGFDKRIIGPKEILMLAE